MAMVKRKQQWTQRNVSSSEKLNLRTTKNAWNKIRRYLRRVNKTKLIRQPKKIEAWRKWQNAWAQ